MIPNFFEILLELANVEGIFIYKSAQSNEWGILKDHMFVMKVSECNISDEFLEFYCRECSLI